jgi:hypothetical protein
MADPKPGDVIAVWFSCGAASAVALKETMERYPHCAVRAINNPVIEEGEDNQRFLRDVETWLGIKIETAIHPQYPLCSAVEVWERNAYMSNPSGAPCTRLLKTGARLEWEKHNRCDWIVMGYPAGEDDRHIGKVERGMTNLLPVLIDAGITKGDCFRIVMEAGIELPEAYRLGYPNANCRGCVKASSPTYWNHVRVVDPAAFKHRAEQSRRLGSKLVRVKGQRIYLDELDPSAQGRPMKDMKIECGIFCQTEPDHD